MEKKINEFDTNTEGDIIEENKTEKMTFEYERKTPFLKVFLSIIAAVMIIAAIYFLSNSNRNTVLKKSTKIQRMQELASKIDNMKSVVNNKQDEIFNLITQYKEQGGKDMPNYNSMNLSVNERKLLEQRIFEEKDNSIKSLLNGILEKNEDIGQLNKKIAEIELLLPKPHIVQKGENHFNISMDFLINQKGIDNIDAKKLAERAGMFENLIPGFRVWNFFSDGIYGTFVTQGSAVISPNQVNRNAKKTLVDAKDKAISERDKIAIELKNLEQKKKEIINQLTILDTEKKKLIANIGVLSKKNEDFKTKINSLYFRLDTKSKLKEKGIIKGGFLRKLKIMEYSPDDFDSSIDLRKVTRILVSGEVFQLQKIKNLIVYPRFLKKDKDFRVEISKDKKKAELIIINIEKMKNERIVISII